MKLKISIIAILAVLGLGGTFLVMRHYQHKKAVKSLRKIIPYEFRVHAHDKSLKGYVLSSPYQQYKWYLGQVMIMDMDGHVYLHKMTPGCASDFRQWKLDGKIYYSYMLNNTDAFHINKNAVIAGYGVILDSAFNEIRQVRLLPHDDVVIDKKQALDPHDLILLSLDHYIAIACYEKNVNNVPGNLKPHPKLKIAADIIQEVKDGKVIWQWDASHYPEFYASSTDKNNFSDSVTTQDYLHINSMTLDPKDSNLICSFRNSDEVVKINRHTGDIMWRLGGIHSDFALLDSQRFQRQHDVTLTDNNQTLLVFDNGDSSKRKTSRVLEFQLDEKNKKVRSFKSFTIPAPYALTMGSVEKRNGHYFIGGGSGKYTIEIDPKTGIKGFDLHSNQLSFRTYWVDSIYGLEKRGVVH